MELPAHYIFLMHIIINKKLHRTFSSINTICQIESRKDPQMKLLRTKNKATAPGSLKCQAWWAYLGLYKNGFPTFWSEVQSSGSQVVVGSAVRSPHTASPPCFQLLHHIKRQLKIHAFLILLFQVSNCCTCHKDVIWLWSKRNMNHDSKNGKVEYKTSSLLKE